MKMKKIFFLLIIITFLAVSCNTTGQSQAWHPRTGKPLKKGRNNK